MLSILGLLWGFLFINLIYFKFKFVAGPGNAGAPLFAAIRGGRYRTVDYILNQYEPTHLSLYESVADGNNDLQMVNVIRKHARPAGVNWTFSRYIVSNGRKSMSKIKKKRHLIAQKIM
jgi:hypothetical protein